MQCSKREHQRGSLSGPAGVDGDLDGKINFNNNLLSGIAPYAYGQGRMGSDRNYQQILIDPVVFGWVSARRNPTAQYHGIVRATWA